MDEKVYTIGELAALAGITVRALRHYDDIGLLMPEREGNGYRIYSKEDAERLQTILAMRACHMPLSDIATILQSPNDDVASKLIKHIHILEEQSDRIERAIQNTKDALTLLEGMEPMDHDQRFEELKGHIIEDLEEAYGEEARQLYGNEAVDAATQRLATMTEDEWNEDQLLEEAIKVQLRIAMATGDPNSEASKELVHMHSHWIRSHWGDGKFREEAYRGLARLYLDDERFIDYYDRAAGKGATVFLVDAILANA